MPSEQTTHPVGTVIWHDGRIFLPGQKLPRVTRTVRCSCNCGHTWEESILDGTTYAHICPTGCGANDFHNDRISAEVINSVEE